jgi:ParB family chromosome partitioning protein
MDRYRDKSRRAITVLNNGCEFLLCGFHGTYGPEITRAGEIFPIASDYWKLIFGVEKSKTVYQFKEFDYKKQVRDFDPVWSQEPTQVVSIPYASEKKEEDQQQKKVTDYANFKDLSRAMKNTAKGMNFPELTRLDVKALKIGEIYGCNRQLTEILLSDNDWIINHIGPGVPKELRVPIEVAYRLLAKFPAGKRGKYVAQCVGKNEAECLDILNPAISQINAEPTVVRESRSSQETSAKVLPQSADTFSDKVPSRIEPSSEIVIGDSSNEIPKPKNGFESLKKDRDTVIEQSIEETRLKVSPQEVEQILNELVVSHSVKDIENQKPFSDLPVAGSGSEGIKELSKKRGRKEKTIGEALKIRDLALAGVVFIEAKWIPVDRIRPMIGQPRDYFNEESLQRLAVSLGIGQAQLITVKIVRDDPLHDYELTNGERRWRSAKIGGIKLILAAIFEIHDEEAQFMHALVSNFGSESHTEMEEIKAISRLQKRGFTHKQIAALLSKEVSWVNQRVLDVSEEIMRYTHPRNNEKRLTLSHLRAFNKIKDPTTQADFSKKVFESNLSAKQTWIEVRRLFGDRKHSPKDDLRAVENSFRRFNVDLINFLGIDFSRVFANREAQAKEEIKKKAEGIIEKVRNLLQKI